MKKLISTVVLVFASLSLLAQPEAETKKLDKSRCHCFIDYENIWTFEMVQNHEGRRVPILNIITFKPGEWELKPVQVQVLNGKSRPARIDKFSIDTGIEDEPYNVSNLKVLGNGFIGVDLLGKFDDYGEPTKVVIDLGENRFELQPMDCMEFDMIAEQINKVNFDSPQIKEDFDTLKIEHKGTRAPRPKSVR